MASKEESLIIRIDLDKKAAGARLVELEKEVLNYRQEQRELNKALKDGEISQTNYAKRMLENKAGMKEARDEQRRLTTAVQAETGSINALRAKLSDLTKQRNATNQSTVEGVQRAKELDAQMLSLSKRISQNEEASGNFSRSVGRYKDDILAAADSTNLFGVNLGQARQAMITANSAILTTNKGLAALKIALVSTGIGAIIVALGTLFTYFTKTARGAEFFERVMAGVSATISVITDRMSLLGEGIVNFFKGDYQAAVTSFKQATTGILDEIVSEAQQGFDLEERRQQLERKRIDFLVEEQKLTQQLERIRTVGEDKSKSAAEQEANTVAAIRLANQLTEKRVSLQQEAVEILRAQKALGENLIEDDRELAQAEADLLAVRNQAEELNRTLNNQLNEIRASGAAKAKQNENELLALQKKNAEEQKEIEQQKIALKIIGLEEELFRERDNNDKKLALNKELIDLKLEQQLIGVQSGSDAELTAIREANLQKLMLDAEYQEEKRQQALDFERMLAEDIEQIQKDISETVRTEVSTRVEQSEKQRDVALSVENARQQAALQTANLVEGAAKEGTALQKTAGIVSVGISSYMGATAALAPPPLGLGPIAGIPLAIATIALGVINAAKIAGLAEGGLVRGPGTGTSDSIPVRLSNGEGVMTAKAVQMFGPELSAMNVAGGGRSFNIPNRTRHYATGGIIQAERNVSEQLSMRELQRSIENMPPPILDMQEFARKQGRIDKKATITNV